MAASETVRLRLQFDDPPPATPHCTVSWLLADLKRCRVVGDLIGLIRQRFGFSSGVFLGLYLEGGLLPPAESARLVRDNDCLRVRLEGDQGLPENLIGGNGGDSSVPRRKAKKRARRWTEDEESDRGSRKHWKTQEDSNHHWRALDPETKLFPHETGRTESKRKSKVAGSPAEDGEEETKKKSSKRKEKREQKKQSRASKSSPKQQTPKEGGSQNRRFPIASPRSRFAKARRRSSPGLKASESCPESVSDSHFGVVMQGLTLSEKLSAELLKEGPATRTAAASRQASKPGLTFSSGKGKASRASSPSSDSSSEAEDQFPVSKSTLEGASDFLNTTGLFAGQGYSGPGLSLETSGFRGWKSSDSSRGREALGPPSAPVPTSLGRILGRVEDFLFGKRLRSQDVQDQGQGLEQAASCILERSSESQKQRQLNASLTNSSSMVIQNPAENPKEDYSLLPPLAAAPQVGEKVAFQILDHTSDYYSPDVTDFKERKLLSHDPETQQVAIGVLSSLPALKEPETFDLVYHNEKGKEVVEYAVTQGKRFTVLWREFIDPRLMLDSQD